MKRNSLFTLICFTALWLAVSSLPLQATDSSGAPVTTYEYVTIRWAGRENTHVIRPNGEVEFVGAQLRNFKKPDRADERSFCMNIVINGLAREGWELTAMTPDDYVMKRPRKNTQ
jgi:hypothetical protein